MGSKNEVSFEYCVGCRWGLRASWLAQELLQTFEPNDGLHKVSLLPIKEPAGTFIVKVNNENIWDRKASTSGGFPETKELKQLIRDRLCPAKPLGHSDKISKRTSEDEAIEEEEIRTVVDTYLEGIYEEDITKVMISTQQNDFLIRRRNEATSTIISSDTSAEEWKDYLAWNKISSSDPMDRSVPKIIWESKYNVVVFISSFVPAHMGLEPDKVALTKVRRSQDDKMVWRVQSHETARLYEQKSDGTNVRSLKGSLFRDIMKS